MSGTSMSGTSMSVPAVRTSMRALCVTLLLYAVLVATHAGEFWPFSIYPMFSKAGRPWNRAVVRELDAADPVPAWGAVPAARLPGDAYPLGDHGIDPIDLANFVAKTQVWNTARVTGLRDMFYADRLGDRRLLVLLAHGALSPTDSVAVEFIPYVLLNRDGALLNPTLAR